MLRGGADIKDLGVHDGFLHIMITREAYFAEVQDRL